MDFKIETFLNPHLPVGASQVSVVFSVQATGDLGAVAARRVFGFLLDVSGSMLNNGKIEALRSAARVAIDLVPDGDEFFVVAFSTTGLLLVPLTVSSRATRQAAGLMVQRLRADGGTYMSEGLRFALREFLKAPGAVCQLMLLTDGDNNVDDSRALEQALAECDGHMQAHCRGFGTDWKVPPLRAISQRLMGTVQLIADVRGGALEHDFRETMAAARGRGLADVRLRLWMPANSQLVSVKQGFPVEVDLTGKLRPVDARSTDIPLGALGAEAQDYCATFSMPAGAPGDERLVCRPSIWMPEAGALVERAKGRNVTVTWTDDASLSMRMNSQVAHYQGETEKAEAIQEGLEALRRNDVATATVRLGRAAQLAAASGDDETTRRLARVVDVVDAEQGTVAVRRIVDKASAMDLDAGSTRTVRATRTTS